MTMIMWLGLYIDYSVQFISSSLCAAAAAESLQSCLTLCIPIDGSPPGSPIPGILWARTLEWVAISFSNAWKGKVKVKSPSHVRLSATSWTAAYQAPPSMGFSRQEYWSGVPLPSPLSLGPFLYFKFPPLWLVNVLHSPFFLWNNNFAQIYQLRSRRKTSYILQLSLTEFTEGLFDRCKRE